MASNKRRREGTTVACPIVYGSTAYQLGKKPGTAGDYATHRWSLFVRGPNGEDVSTFVQKVAFTLHPSFIPAVREIRAAPFEVSETGWGEFEASIRLYFKDPDEQPVDLFHTIKLYPTGPLPPLSQKKAAAAATGAPGAAVGGPLVVSESYDEVVFASPTEKFLQKLTLYTPRSTKQQGQRDRPPYHPASAGSTVFDDSLDVEKLLQIQDAVAREIDEAKSALLHTEALLVDLRHTRREAAMEEQQRLQRGRDAGRGVEKEAKAAKKTDEGEEEEKGKEGKVGEAKEGVKKGAVKRPARPGGKKAPVPVEKAPEAPPL